MGLDSIAAWASIAGVVLAFVFWLLAARQASQASRTLIEVKDTIISWQVEINRASVDLIRSRPEMIAREATMAEAQAHAAFLERLSAQVAELTRDLDEKNTGCRLAAVEHLLAHHRELILGSEQIKANAAMGGNRTN